MIPLKSRIAALPGVGPMTFLGSSVTVTLAISYVLGPVSFMGYLPAALAGAFVGVTGTFIVLGPLTMAIEEVNGAPFQKGDTVQVLNGKHKGARGRVEKTSSYHDGAYVTVDVDGEERVYGKLDIFLIRRIDGEAPAARSFPEG